MPNNDEFNVWLRHKIFYSWAKKYQKPALFEDWLIHLTHTQKIGFYKQFVQDKLQSYVQKTKT